MKLIEATLVGMLSIVFDLTGNLKFFNLLWNDITTLEEIKYIFQ